VAGKLKPSSNKAFTAELGMRNSGRDEANGFIAGEKPLACHPNTGR